MIVRLHDDLGDAGDVLVGINVHGMNSNRVRIGIDHVGARPPDDLNTLKQIKGSNFEVVKMENIVTP